MPKIEPIAVAFPLAEGQRELLRRIAPEITLPALYRDGAETRPCTACKMELNVGPRVLAVGIPIYCLICAQHFAETLGATLAGTDVLHLGNPESRPERGPRTDDTDTKH